ncbi:hypothetical protein CR513_34085, partial [Mucuna pruriens]
MSQMLLVGSKNIPSQTIPNLKGGVSVVTLRSGKEFPQQSTPQPQPRPVNAKLESYHYHFPPKQSQQGCSSNENLLKMFQRVEINIPLLDAIKQIPKYAKFLKELCMHKRKKLKGGVKTGGVVSTLIKNEEVTVVSQQLLPKKCNAGPRCINQCHAIFNIQVFEFSDLEPTGMVIQLANRSIVQPLGILEDVLVQVNELIFPTDFNVLDMEDETIHPNFGTIIFMTAITKIDVHAGTLSMKFGDNLVQFNIFEAMKHPTEDHSIFSINMIDELVEEYMQIGTDSADFFSFAEMSDVMNYFNSVEDVPDYDLFDSNDNIADLADMVHIFQFSDLIDLVCWCNGNPKCPSCARLRIVDTKRRVQVATIVEARSDSGNLESKQAKAKSDSGQPSLHLDKVGQLTLTLANKLKLFPHHLKYAYLDDHQQFLVIIANNLHREQEEKLLKVLRKHKKAIGWTLVDLPRINPSICMHKILLEEEAQPIRQ